MSSGTGGGASGDGKGRGGLRRGAGRSRKEVTTTTEQRPPQATGQQQQVRTEPTEADTGGHRVRRTRGEGSGESSPTESSPPSTSPPSESPQTGDDLAERLKRMQMVELRTRPGYGTQGRRIAVLANHFKIQIPDGLILSQYHIEVSLGNMKLNRDEKRVIFWRCVKSNLASFGNLQKVIYDGDHICVTQGQVKFPTIADPTGGFNFHVDVRLDRMDHNPASFQVRFQYVGIVAVDVREVETTSGPEGRNTTPLNVLDLLFRQNRSCPEMDVSKAWYPFGPTVYRIPDLRTAPPLGYGQAIWQGLFGTCRVGEDYTPFMNFDISHSSFYRPSTAIDFMIDILNSTMGGKFKYEQLTSETALPRDAVHALNREFKGLSVVTEVKPKVGEIYKREHRVNCISDKDAITATFPLPLDGGGVRECSVAEYFQERYGPLKFPRLPVLSVGRSKREIFLPIERCEIKPCQRVAKKLLPAQTAEMIKVTAIAAPNRQQNINQLVQAASLPQDPWLRSFGVRVKPEMERVEARILPSPKIVYGNGKTSTVDPNKGAWDQRNQKYFLPAGTQKIGAIVIDDGREAQMYRQFFGYLMQTCREFGMAMPQTIPDTSVRLILPVNVTKELEPRLKEFASLGMDLVLVCLTHKPSPHYADVKRIAEINYGLMTQCVVRATVQKVAQKQDRMTSGNIALKINAKLGGISWKGEAEAAAKQVLEEQPTLILGIDVTHPGPTEKKAPSIATVVGNLDTSFMRYGASVRVQKHRREAVVYLQEPVRERMFEYYNRGNQLNEERKQAGKPLVPHGKPQRIIIYRDGVAEGQFQEMLKTELVSVREACQTLGGPDYKPSITFIVGQKRHHTRFFPLTSQEGCGRGGNIFLGTVVDKIITHPKLFEFYLCSHFGIQGTSRPIRYHVLTDDNRFTADQLQNLTFYLSHCFARCTRPVSLPAPLYYADLACRRARIHLHDKITDFSSDTMSQSATGESGSGEAAASAISEEELMRGSTVAQPIKLRMYFV